MILLIDHLGHPDLGDLVGTTLMTGLWLGYTLILGYKLLTAYVAKIVVSACLGMWILDKINRLLSSIEYADGYRHRDPGLSLVDPSPWLAG